MKNSNNNSIKNKTKDKTTYKIKKGMDKMNLEQSKVDSVEKLQEVIEKVKNAQKEYAKFSQEQVDKIFQKAAIKANKMRIPLAKMAVKETGMGVVEDKVIKITMQQNIYTTNTKTKKQLE